MELTWKKVAVFVALALCGIRAWFGPETKCDWERKQFTANISKLLNPLEKIKEELEMMQKAHQYLYRPLGASCEELSSRRPLLDTLKELDEAKHMHQQMFDTVKTIDDCTQMGKGIIHGEGLKAVTAAMRIVSLSSDPNRASVEFREHYKKLKSSGAPLARFLACGMDGLVKEALQLTDAFVQLAEQNRNYAWWAKQVSSRTYLGKWVWLPVFNLLNSVGVVSEIVAGWAGLETSCAYVAGARHILDAALAGANVHCVLQTVEREIPVTAAMLHTDYKDSKAEAILSKVSKALHMVENTITDYNEGKLIESCVLFYEHGLLWAKAYFNIDFCLD